MNQSQALPAGLPRRPRALIARLWLAFAAVALPLSGHPSGYWPAPVAAPLASSGAYVVNSTLDTPADNPSLVVCADANGRCTLRAAIMRTNVVAGPSTIMLPPGVYRLTRVGFDDAALVGDLDISSDLTILGAGSGTTIVDGNGAVTHDRVFQILASAGNVSLSGLTIRNGQAPAGTIPSLIGGGIYRDGTAGAFTRPTLQLSDVVLEGNTAKNGGGLHAAFGQLTLSHVSLHSNAATNSGGGLYADGSYLTLSDSQVYSNSALAGGGLLLDGVNDAHIDRTEIYSNTATANGGGISSTNSNSYPFDQVTLLDSYLHNNHADNNGGAIDNYPALVISRTVLDSNSAGVYGGGLNIYGPDPTAAMLINRSTLSRNWAQYGGGINFYDNGGTQSALAVVNSTLSGNAATHEGGGLYADGFAHITLDNATIAGNRLNPPMFHPFSVVGGGLFITSTAIITAQNTIIADNFLSHGIQPATPDDCFGPLRSLFYNLVEDLTKCNLSTLVGSVTGKDPLLGPLTGAGGTPGIQDLLPGSPAIDAGNTNGCRDDQGQLLSTDERGFVRPIGPRCDIGAVEYSPFGLVLPLITR